MPAQAKAARRLRRDTVSSQSRYVSSVKPTPNQQDRDYLSKYWDILAAIAWKEYTIHGRGAVLVQNADQPDEDAIYITVDMLGGPITGEYAHMAAGYEPREEIVVILMRPPSPVTAYRGCLPSRSAPPEAYRQLDAVLCGDWGGKHRPLHP